VLRRLTKRAEMHPCAAGLGADGGVHSQNLWVGIVDRGAPQSAQALGCGNAGICNDSFSHGQQLRRQPPMRLRVVLTAGVGRVLRSSMMGVVPVGPTCECQAS